MQRLGRPGCGWQHTERAGKVERMSVSREIEMRQRIVVLVQYFGDDGMHVCIYEGVNVN
jgi:hypothetical protein